MHLSDLIVPCIITLILLTGLLKKVNVMPEFAEGAKENLHTAVSILPSLILLMTAVGMFTASGAADSIAVMISPALEFLGFPKECLSLAMIRPISGSGAIAALENILTKVSPDSFEGRVASVLMASTETTFYTITVYFGALKQKPDIRVFIAAIAADISGFVFSVLFVRLFFM